MVAGTSAFARDVLTPTDTADTGWPERIAGHVELVEHKLTRELDELQRAWDDGVAGTAAPYDIDLPARVRELLDRGGKRTRPVMTLLGWVAADVRHEERGYDNVLRAAAAIELLHCFALVHDDVMDESQTRRGRPTVHAEADRQHRDLDGIGSSARFGDSIAILVGDLAHSEADRLAASLPAPMRRIWQQMVLELLTGQLWDVTGTAAAERGLGFARQVARRKTGYYTVARPLQLGAAAGGATETSLLALAEYGRHAGEAFALRDDMLGVFGDPATTGKPAGDDLRTGKPTVLLAVATETLRGPAADALAAAGSPHMTDDQVRTALDAMLAQGVAATVEAMIDDRANDAVAALRTGALAPDGVAQLTHVVDHLARRER